MNSLCPSVLAFFHFLPLFWTKEGSENSIIKKWRNFSFSSQLLLKRRLQKFAICLWLVFKGFFDSCQDQLRTASARLEGHLVSKLTSSWWSLSTKPSSVAWPTTWGLSAASSSVNSRRTVTPKSFPTSTVTKSSPEFFSATRECDFVSCFDFSRSADFWQMSLSTNLTHS